MVNNPAHYVQDVDNGNECYQAMEDCLRNPVIVRKILENSSSSQLLKLSLVNKLWNYEARRLLGKRGGLIAYVKSHDGFPQYRPTGQVEAFISDLKQMNPVPFSGISIDIYSQPLIDANLFEDPDLFQGVVLNQPSFKTVSVEFEGRWLEDMASPGIVLIKKVLQDCSGFLEELSLHVGDGQGKTLIEKVVQDYTFPRLKILKLKEWHRHGSDELGYENYMKALVSRTPILQVLHSNWSINLLLRVLEGTAVVPVYADPVDAPFQKISEDVVSAIRLANMKMVYTGPEFDFQRFNRITPTLLQASCATTLVYLTLDAVLALPLMSYGICLKNVKYLHMDINHRHLERTEPRILSIVKNFDFTRIFPNLNKVDINPPAMYGTRSQPSLDHMNGIIEQANLVLREPMPDRAANVKTLYLHQNLSSVAVQFFAEMLPSTDNLGIRTVAPDNFPFESVWKNWLNLKDLEMRGYTLPTTGNLDSVFCGIFPEEVAELRLKDDEYLKKVNIVPVMPAVTCLRNLLRTLSVHHEHFRVYPFGDDDATFMFSKVTALLAFARQPALAVSVKISASAVPPAMDHLKPYMSVKYDRP